MVTLRIRTSAGQVNRPSLPISCRRSSLRMGMDPPRVRALSPLGLPCESDYSDIESCDVMEHLASPEAYLASRGSTFAIREPHPLAVQALIHHALLDFEKCDGDQRLRRTRPQSNHVLSRCATHQGISGRIAAIPMHSLATRSAAFPAASCASNLAATEKCRLTSRARSTPPYADVRHPK